MRERRAKRIAQRTAADALEEGERRRALPAGRDHVLAGHDVKHAGKLPGFGRIDADDPGMGAVGTQEVRANLPRHVVIGGVAAAAGDQTGVLTTAFVLMVGQVRTSPVAVPGMQARCHIMRCAEVHTWRWDWQSIPARPTSAMRHGIRAPQLFQVPVFQVPAFQVPAFQVPCTNDSSRQHRQADRPRSSSSRPQQRSRRRRSGWSATGPARRRCSG